jgi:predicted house-cleaning noncanonical NTP pyrophosphatase (MazG superfamily)
MILKMIAALEMGDTEFLGVVGELKEKLKTDVRIIETNSDLETLPAISQYWLAQRADLEFFKRQVERDMRIASGPSLMKITKSHYVTSKILDAALQEDAEYAKLQDRLSRITYVLDLINSTITSLWFKRDSLVNLSITQRKQLSFEQRDW